MNEKNPERRLRLVLAVAVACCSLSAARQLGAQAGLVTMLDFATGSQYEDYLRVLQISGKVPLYPWSIRGFSRREIERLALADSAGPWNLRGRFSSSHFSAGPLTLGATFNSAYPYGANDGPLWSGRGLTVAASGGVSGHIGPLSFSLAPMAFRAANKPFDLLPNGAAGNLAYGDGLYPTSIDLPQRFGIAPYSRLDPGNSYIRLDSRLITVGVSTANEWIGPATEYPFLLSNNAPGFPHLFVGIGDPLNVWIGRVQARVLWGKLDQSDYSPVTGSTHFLSSTSQTGTVRLMTSVESVLLPRGISGLEIGAARFFHVRNRLGEPSGRFWAKPFRDAFFSSKVVNGDSTAGDNQLASVFFRWAFPNSGFEVYGERGYEDQFYDLREFIQNVDHDRAYMLGFQKTLSQNASRLDVLKAELINYQRSTLALTRLGEGAVYLHGQLRQGHTNRGQLLGASAGAGAAAASTLSWTRYAPRSLTTVTLRRIVRGQIGDYQLSGVINPRSSDVIIAAGLERTRYGPIADFSAGADAMQDLNRNFRKDVPNLNLRLSVRLHSR